MAELTKEWLQQTIADLEEEGDAVPGAVNEDAAMALAAMKIALASIESEAVAVRAQWKDEGSGHGNWKYYDIAHRDSLMADENRECELICTSQPAPASVPDNIDARMKNAGMLSATEIIAGQPIDAFMKHAGVVDLASLLKWAEMRRAEFLRMQAKYVLGDNPKDDMYEWVISHVAAFSELHVNIRAAMLQGAEPVSQTYKLNQLSGNSPVTPDDWISCSEQMPDDAQWCVVNTEYGYYVQCWSEGQGWLGDDISIPECDVINWMPLPEPPQEVK
ncbi:hypothetical protein WP3S18E09_12420 [Escherichia coli]|uniref:DUF551 domain-containing protein n=2 Tax=Escherichia coli TaxID=562 RepID=UPI0015DCD4EC|nr:DUF551 domain-containing protein [Escherichia coli]BBR34229.1 hypothetical protein WP3S18E09_12420 [Escherichia coli]